MEAHGDNYARPPRRGPSLGTVVLLALIFGVIAGFGGAVLALWANQTGHLASLFGSSDVAAVPLGTQYASSTASDPQGTFASVADNMDESVVNINTMAVQQNPASLFFGGGGSQVVRGLGTGVVVASDGYILTNYHVIDNARNIKVTIMHKGGKREYTAKLVGGDKAEDLAVIKINASGLKPVRFGNSNALRPGEWVMAIGNPFGFEHTVSVGVVSALNRSLPVDDTVTLRNMIQTDASINPGNSGGPLVNLNGEVVGINSAVFVGQGSGEPQASGIGFSIPSNHAKSIMEQLRKGSRIPHPYIGISYREITDEMRSQLHLPVKNGVLVMQALANGPAGKAGVARGDVIVSVDKRAIRDQSVLTDYINTQHVGDTITLDIRRWNDGNGSWEQKTLRVKVGNKPADFAQRLNSSQDGNDVTPVPDQGEDNGNGNGNGGGISPWGF